MCHACCGIVCIICGMLCNVYCVTRACYIYWVCCMLQVLYRLPVCASCVLNTVCHTSALYISDVYCVVLIYSVHIMGIAYISWDEWCVFCVGWAPHALCATYMLHIQGIGCIYCTLHITHMLHKYAVWIGCYWYYALSYCMLYVSCALYVTCVVYDLLHAIWLLYILCVGIVLYCVCWCVMCYWYCMYYMWNIAGVLCYMSILCEFCTMCCACCVLYGSYVWVICET